MAEDSISELRQRYRAFLGPEPENGVALEQFRLDNVLPGDTFRDELRDYFARNPRPEVLEVLAPDGQRVGFSWRARLSEPDRTAGPGSGDSQGATLPGESTGYRVVWFRCKQHQPMIWLPVAYYDERYPPACPKDAKHKTEYVP